MSRAKVRKTEHGSAVVEGKEAKEQPRPVGQLIPVSRTMEGGSRKMVVVAPFEDNTLPDEFNSIAVGDGPEREFAQAGYPTLGFQFVHPRDWFPSEPTDLRHLVTWKNAWCRPNAPFPFKLNTTLLEARNGVTRVDMLYGLVPRKEDTRYGYFSALCEVSDYLVNDKPAPTMRNWFLMHYLTNVLNELKERKAFWSQSFHVLRSRTFNTYDIFQDHVELLEMDDDDRRWHRLHWALYDPVKVGIYHGPQDGEGARVAALQKLQDDITFLENVREGRGDHLDARKLFAILTDGKDIAADVDPDWWYEEARRSWEVHRGKQEAKSLSWAGTTAVRHYGHQCLIQYIADHYPRGAVRIRATPLFRDVEAEPDWLEKHPMVQATKTMLLSKWVRPSTGAETLPFPLARHATRFLAGKARVKLFKD